MNQDKLSEAQQFVLDKYYSNSNFDCGIHKHRKSKAWFQVNSRSWYQISDQTIKALVSKGYLKQENDNHWLFTEKALTPNPNEPR